MSERTSWVCVTCGRTNAPHLDHCDHVTTPPPSNLTLQCTCEYVPADPVTGYSASMIVNPACAIHGKRCTCKSDTWGTPEFGGGTYSPDPKCPLHGRNSMTLWNSTELADYATKKQYETVMQKYGRGGGKTSQVAKTIGCSCTYHGAVRHHELECPIHNERRNRIVNKEIPLTLNPDGSYRIATTPPTILRDNHDE